jgi:uncharacterized protein with GYD domain
MATYLLLAKLSPEGAKGVMSEGAVNRREVAEKMAATGGGRVLAYYAVNDGDWDFMNLVEWPPGNDPQLSRLSHMLTGTGAYERLRLFHLTSCEEYDAGANDARLQSAQQAYHPPGQS